MLGDSRNEKIFDMAYNFARHVDLDDALYSGDFSERDNKVFIVSGRMEKHRYITEHQLSGIDYKKLYMRKEGDYRPDVEVKKEILE